MPRETSGRPNDASSAATRMSQAIASSQPPPSAKPLTAAMTGFHISSPRMSVGAGWSQKMLRCGPPSLAFICAISLRSAPALNARSPAPVITMLRMSEFSRTCAQASTNALRRSVFIAFIDSGRFMVITKVRPSMRVSSTDMRVAPRSARACCASPAARGAGGGNATLGKASRQRVAHGDAACASLSFATVGWDELLGSVSGGCCRIGGRPRRRGMRFALICGCRFGVSWLARSAGAVAGSGVAHGDAVCTSLSFAAVGLG